MPRFDGTGPLGAGAGSGWGLGPCGAGMGRRGTRRGQGWGGGWGRGWGKGFSRFSGYPYTPQITRKEEKEMLTEEVDILEGELKEIKKRLAELKGKN